MTVPIKIMDKESGKFILSGGPHGGNPAEFKNIEQAKRYLKKNGMNEDKYALIKHVTNKDGPEALKELFRI